MEETKKETPKKEVVVYDPNKKWLGYVYQVLHIITFCAQQFIVKILSMRHPGITTSQVLVLRSTFSVFVILAIMNVNTKYYMYDSIPKD